MINGSSEPKKSFIIAIGASMLAPIRGRRYVMRQGIGEEAMGQTHETVILHAAAENGGIGAKVGGIADVVADAPYELAVSSPDLRVIRVIPSHGYLHESPGPDGGSETIQVAVQSL